jgi:hypothetical protein
VEAIGKNLRVFRTSKAAHHEVAVVAANENMSGLAEGTPGAQNITSLFMRPAHLSVGLRRAPFLRRRPKTTPECPSDAGYGLRCQSSAAIRPLPTQKSGWSALGKPIHSPS